MIVNVIPSGDATEGLRLEVVGSYSVPGPEEFYSLDLQ